MIKIVHKNKHLAELLSRDTSSIYFSCVLNSSMSGQVWVDNIEKPSFAVVWSEYQKGFQLMGEPLEKYEYGNLRLFFETVIFQLIKEKGLSSFECGGDTEELIKMLFEIFNDKNMETEQQKIFGLNQIICPNEDSIILNKEFEIVAIDDAFFKREFENKEYVMKEIIDTWTSKEAYLKNGYGYAAVIGNYIVSRALVTCGYKKHDNIGVDTLKEYRRRGISTILVYHTLLEARKRDRMGIWDCSEDNVASERTALSVGFELKRTETICWFDV